MPQMVISFGNGLMLPGAIAGAVSVRPQAAGTAAGITGFAQMALGAAIDAIRRHAARQTPTSAVPMALLDGRAGASALVRRASRHRSARRVLNDPSPLRYAHGLSLRAKR